jgi:O-acetyl-ADP-ribose deacetylase
MSDEKKIKNSVIRLAKGDITDFEIECFVFYAQADLKLGSGYGSAIAMRGGPQIQKELDQLAPIKLGEAVISAAGGMKAKQIIHANGPKFQEEDLENKLRTTTENALKLADARGIKHVAFPPMGSGFYGVPLAVSARITIDTVKQHLEGKTGLEEVVFCLLDSREYGPFQTKLQTLG